MKTFETTIIFIAFAIAVASCQRSEEPTFTTDNSASIIATISNDATRATFTDNPGVSVALTWEVNDEIMLYDASGNYAATFVTSSGGGATATFTLSVGSAVDGTYTAVYPAYYTSPGVPAPTLAHRSQIVNGLTQDGNNSIAHLDLQCYMRGKLVYSSGGFTSNAVTFDVEFALLTVEIDTPTAYAATDGAPTSLTLHNGSQATALFLRNFTTTDMMSGLTLYMVVDPYKNPTATPGEERTLHFELITENAVFLKERANVSKEYEAGKRYTAALTGADIMASAIGIYTLEALFADPSRVHHTTWVVIDAITSSTSSTSLITLNLAITSSGKSIRLILPNATSIGNEAFGGCANLTSISLPAATSIGNEAFFSCTALTSISLPAATSIGDYAFYGCANLSSISLPAATSIGNSVFSSCAALTSISLPSATSIGDDALGDCANLTSISLPAATSIGEHAFYLCSNLTSISLPAATSIGDDAFRGCVALTSISLPKAISIGDYALAGSNNLYSISLPAATSIGEHAFFGCTNLTSVSLPMATSIGDYAFRNTALTHLQIGGATEMTTVGVNLFAQSYPVGNMHLIVGAGEAANVNTVTKMWRSYGPFNSITIR